MLDKLRIAKSTVTVYLHDIYLSHLLFLQQAGSHLANTPLGPSQIIIIRCLLHVRGLHAVPKAAALRIKSFPGKQCM